MGASGNQPSESVSVYIHSIFGVCERSQYSLNVSCTNPSGDRNDFNDLRDLRKQIRDAHNYYRCLHGVPPLKLQGKLNKYAQKAAEDNARKGALMPSGGLYGENLYSSYGVPVNGLAITKFWYDKIKDYNFNYPAFSSSQFSQVVWLSSTGLGCGYIKNANEWSYIVCSYDPPGNIPTPEQFSKNVPLPLYTINNNDYI
ncbi:secreted protein RBT4-like [Anneissia japonica]|uniref:secreted protein RBT4-like n=1 Tax=Anneissia japonica TaxID=1529436 RepID=UPI0014254EAC|nr:secreted protein RBT4-like [Anneissia japonica]